MTSVPKHKPRERRPANTYSCQTSPSGGSLWPSLPPCPSSHSLPPPGGPQAPGRQSAECSHTPASLLFLVPVLYSRAECLCQTILQETTRKAIIATVWILMSFCKNKVCRYRSGTLPCCMNMGFLSSPQFSPQCRPW